MGYLIIALIFSVAAFFVYPHRYESKWTEQLVNSILFGIGFAVFVAVLGGLGFGGGDTEMYYRR